MKELRRIICALLALIMMIRLLPQTVFAAEYRAYVKFADGTVKNYESFRTAWDAAAASNKAAVGLLSNWDSGRYVVPDGKTMTLELNGYFLTRNLAESDGKSDGDVLTVGNYATLNVYGGNEENPSYRCDAEHSVWVWVPKEYDKPDRKQVKLYGGIINGGNSTNGGGGINLREGSALFLSNVTVAGNQADNVAANWGDGGGIYFDEDYGYLYMEDSRICYNFAEWDGGGIFVDSDADYCFVEMKNSSIDHNTADDNGGGIYVEAENFKLIGDAQQIMTPENLSVKDWSAIFSDYTIPSELGSSISYNYVYDSQYGGGGIYLYDKNCLIAGVNIIGNNATNTDDTCNGGGIYFDDESLTVRNCNILRNHADKRGGGIYNNGKKNTVDSCTICRNVAMDSDGAGGGIFVWGIDGLAIGGSFIIRGNTSKDYSNDNLFLTSQTYPALLSLALSSGADVHIRLVSKHTDKISKDPGTYNETWFTYDNDSSHHIGWDRNDRYLRLVDGEKKTITRSYFYPDSGSRTLALDKSYNGYPLIEGIMQYPAFNDASADVSSIFYYSDGFFAGSTTDYDEHLATASMCLAGASGYSNLYGTANDDSYLDKSRNFRQFVSDIGCRDEDIFVNDFNMQKPGKETIGVGIASKPIFDGKNLVIIGVRGMGYEAEWVSNMTLGSSGEAQGWSLAAGQIMAELQNYLTRKGIDGSSENTIFWIAGYSRAGATANLTAKRIVDTYDKQGTHTFAYPIEAPMGGTESEKLADSNYNCIHNVINQNDIVPWVGTTEMGFIRYGVDHFVPGSTETHEPVDGSDINVIPEDNSAWKVGSANYTAQRTKMLTHLEAINPGIVFDDYFHTATIDYIVSAIYGTDMIIETGDRWNTEEFVAEFFKKLQEYGFRYGTDGNPLNPAMASRDYFSQYFIENRRTFQNALGTAAGLIFGKSDKETEGLMECFSNLMVRLETGDKYDIYDALEEDQIKDLKPQINKLWDKLANLSDEEIACGYESITSYLSAEEYRELSACFLPLLFPLLCFVAVDYDKYDQDLTGTLAYNISRIIANHYPEVTHAWLRSYDSFYENDRFVRVLAPNRITEPSPVSVEITDVAGNIQIVSGDGITEPIAVSVNDVVRLLPEKTKDRDIGEAIYYQFTSGKSTVQTVHAYTEPFRLKDMIDDYADDGVFTMQVTAAHDGQKLAPVTIALDIQNCMTVSVPVSCSGDEVVYQEYKLPEGESISLNDIRSGDPDVSFREWTVYYVNGTETGSPVDPQLYDEYFGEGFQPDSASTMVTNLEGGSFRFIPVWDDNIKSITVEFCGILDEEGLPDSLNWKVTGDAEWVKEWEVLSWSCSLDRYENKQYEAKFLIEAPAGMRFVVNPLMNIEWTNLDQFAPLENLQPELEYMSVSGQMAHFTVTFSDPDLELNEPLKPGTINASCATVIVHDLKTDTELETVSFYSDEDTVEVSAPIIENEEFVGWADDHSTDAVRTVPTGTVLIAEYRPLVRNVEIVLTAPVNGGEALPALESVKLDGVICEASMEWSSKEESARYDKLYCAHVVIPRGALSESSFAENTAAVVKDADGKELELTGIHFCSSTDMREIYLYFTTLKQRAENPAITAFAAVSVSVPHGSTQQEILDALPDTVYAYLEDGRLIQVSAEWIEAGSADADNPEIQNVQAQGMLTEDVLEMYELTSGLTLTADVVVLGLEKTAIPQATPSSGEYEGNLTIRLSAGKGARIFYAAVTASDDADLTGLDELSYQEYTGPITLTQYNQTTYLYAYAMKDGLANSEVARYIYQLKEPSDPAASSVTLDIKETEMPTESALQLTATVKPSGAENKKVIWTSSDEEIATVDENGLVKALRYGKVTITATAEADNTVFDTCEIQTRFYDVNDDSRYYYTPVYWAADNEITTGYDRVYFGPQKNCTRQELAIFLWRLAGKPEVSGTLPFSDTKYDESSASFQAILWCSQNGIVKGYSDGTFKPKANVERKDAMIMLYRLAGKPDVEGEIKFPDVVKMNLSKTSDTYRAILWGVNNGITNGYKDGSFKPKAKCLREHIVTFIYRADKVISD